MSSVSPTRPTRAPRSEVQTLEQNVSSLVAAKQALECSRGLLEHVADAITTFSGTLPFVFLHAIWFAGWILWNTSFSRSVRFDPYPFGMLTTIVSLEAIFLTTFVLITQNRQARTADRRADLDVQINLLAEHEITRLLRLTHAIANHLGIDTQDVGELQELERDVLPGEVMNQLDAAEGGR
jgi:uncharacterized membrane protein